MISQKTLKHTRFGRISVKCYYDAPEQRLTVEILHAADIIALDANGKTVKKCETNKGCFFKVEISSHFSGRPQVSATHLS